MVHAPENPRLGGYNADPYAQFRAALRGRGIIPPELLIDDGQLHRCDAEGHEGRGDATYVLHCNGFPAGGFQNWTDGAGWQNWRRRSRSSADRQGAGGAAPKSRGRSGAARD